MYHKPYLHNKFLFIFKYFAYKIKMNFKHMLLSITKEILKTWIKPKINMICWNKIEKNYKGNFENTKEMKK